MELTVSTQEPTHSPSVSESNPDEKEISDDDDDDRNHKHRRRDDARSQSQERDTVEQVFTKPYKRGNNNNNKPFENGHIYKETGSQSSEPWKSYNFNPTDPKFDKRRPGPSDLNQRIRGDVGPIRGRGWNQRDSRLNSVDIANQIVKQGPVPVPPGLFGNRGLPSVSNAYGASWGAFGMVPGMANGGLDALHPLGLQGGYRNINPAMNMGLGLARQRCRDFEEQGFCLRGDMCPMEHGVNRIVVEDVQSLSQFNLPVSLQNTNMPGPSGGPTNPMFSSKTSHNKTNKRGVNNNGPGSNDVGADFYDPDQPLWGNDSQTSPALQSITQPNVKENEPSLDPSPLTDHQAGPLDEHVLVKSRKNKSQMRENIVSKAGPSRFQKTESGNGKSSGQKAECTLFVNRVPLEQNKRETLISHFHKFGEVVNIRIPINTERAFVQFSKKEEAEAALAAPDAVMGNRFIKLWWANRDNIPVNGTISGINNTVSSALHNDKITPTKPLIINTPKVPPPPAQKKLDNLEVLREELRKKQEMLDQKRNDFRRKLDKLAKQATSVKGEVEAEHVAKRPKLGTLAATETVSSSPKAEARHNGNKSTAVIAPQDSPPILKPSLRPLTPVGLPAVTNRFKLDNRPSAFKIISTLPNDLADVAVLKEHFSPFGDFCKVELEDDPVTAKYSARVYFTTRHSAEKAFLNGKSCNGHNFQFSWIKSSNCDSPLSNISKRNSDASVGPVVEEVSKTDSEKPDTSGDGDSEKMESKEISEEKTEPDESIQASE